MARYTHAYSKTQTITFRLSETEGDKLEKIRLELSEKPERIFNPRQKSNSDVLRYLILSYNLVGSTENVRQKAVGQRKNVRQKPAGNRKGK